MVSTQSSTLSATLDLTCFASVAILFHRYLLEHQGDSGGLSILPDHTDTNGLAPLNQANVITIYSAQVQWVIGLPFLLSMYLR